jgi:trehalose/maltose hydrolase-like predicted phosphorylase
MKQYLKHDEWSIIEEGFHREHNRISESVFSIGNGRMGQRANFEEAFSGDTLQGNYVAGIYYPDKTRVGWWKNGYPEYFAKVLNAANWIGIDVKLDGETLDLAQCEVEGFRRELNMKEGYLERSFTATLTSGKKVKVHARRLCSIVDDEAGAIRYAITPLNFSGTLSLTPFIDADVINEDSNYDEKFWVEVDKKVKRRSGFQAEAWAFKWSEADIVIEGDVAAQQGIRFNIFQLCQTYTGEDERLNIGPKGFTGEKYGGSTYWDTEAYCLPFYLATADSDVARNLLIYRYKHLAKAIENAAKLGFKDGAALYPMVTMNGEECHNEWEITFEEIHRNGAIAYAIYDFVRYTGEKDYLEDYGLEVLIGIARFWAQRVHFSKRRGKYVMHGVTGPNEYENNVNNNWYTNYIAVWCMRYAKEVLDYVKTSAPEKYEALAERIHFYEYTETAQWKEICDNMYLPEDQELGVFVQHDGFLDKDLHPRGGSRPFPAAHQPEMVLGPHPALGVYQAGRRAARALFLRRPFRRRDHPAQFRLLRAIHRARVLAFALRARHPGLAPGQGGKGLRNVPPHRPPRPRRLQQRHRRRLPHHQHGGTWMSFVKGFGGMRVLN